MTKPLAIATLALAGTPAAAATIDFEGFAGQPVVGEGTPQEGVNVDGGTDLGGFSFDKSIRVGQFFFTQAPPALDGFTAIATDGLFAPRDYRLTGTFDATVSFLEIGVGDCCKDKDTAILRGFDAAGDLVDEVTGIFGQNAGEPNSGFISIAGTGIKSFFLDVQTGSFDNITFTEDVAPVPLPASAALLLAGLAGLGIARRRTR